MSGMVGGLPPGSDLEEIQRRLRAYTKRTGAVPLALSGWESEDPAFAPPLYLAERIASVPHRPWHYTYGRDFAQAREIAAHHFGADLKMGGATLTAAQIAFAANGTQGLLLALAALQERGIQRLVIAAPCYYAVIAIAHQLGIATEIVPAADYLTGALDVTAVLLAVTGGGVALLITNPAYSVGVEYAPEMLEDLLARLPVGTPVIVDETRLGLPWNRPFPWYRADLPGEILILRSPSKIFMLHGAKLSVVIAPAAWIALIDRFQEMLVGSVPGHTEAMALAYLSALSAWQGGEPTLSGWHSTFVARLRKTLRQVERALVETPWQLAPVDSGPHVLAASARTADVPGVDPCRAAELGVLLMTGPYFFHQHPQWQGFRIHLCLTPATAASGLRRCLIDPVTTLHAFFGEQEWYPAQQ